MKTYIIESVYGSRVPFKVRACSGEEALKKVFEHMGMETYKIVGVIEDINNAQPNPIS